MNSKEDVKRYWDSSPIGTKYSPFEVDDEKFFKFTEERRGNLEPFIDSYIKSFDLKNKKVLEVGCGIGIDTIKLINAGGIVSAVDISPRSVEIAKKRLSYHKLKANIEVGDAENLNFNDGEFDFVYSWGVIHHSPNFEKCLSEIYRVLKPGGEFCLMIYNSFSLVALQLYLLHGLFRLRPLITRDELFGKYLESPGTKAFSKKELIKKLSAFRDLKINTELTPYDLRISKNIFLPTFFKIFIPKVFGFFIIVRGKK